MKKTKSKPLNLNNRSYYFNKIIRKEFNTVLDLTIEALKEEGFGILTDIDIQATMKTKLNVDFRPYKILGACNPPFAYEALMTEDKIGTLLPFNVIVIEKGEREVEVAAVNPLVSMQAVENESLEEIAKMVGDKLKKVIAHLN